jgi:hypothetical protein
MHNLNNLNHCLTNMNTFSPQPKSTRKARRLPSASEADIQCAVDRLLALRGVSNIRIPDAVYRAFKTGAMPSPGPRMGVLASLRGWPDNTLYWPLVEIAGVKYCLAAMVEVKTATGELHGQQKHMAKALGYNVVRDVSEVETIIGKAEAAIRTIQEAIKRMLGTVNV